jgi:thioredoxin 1
VEPKKKFLYATVMGGMADAICNYGNIARTCTTYGLERMNVLYFGNQDGVVDLLSGQKYVGTVVQQEPTSDRNQLVAFCMATLRYDVAVEDWLPLTDCSVNPHHIIQTHTTADLHRNPIARRMEMRLPEELERKWRYIPPNSVLVHPFSPGTDPSEQWEHWKHSVMWAWRRHPHVVVSSHHELTHTLGLHADNVTTCVNPTMLDLFAIANRCRMVVTTSDALAFWTALTNKPAIVICEKGFATQHPYYYNWINASCNRLMNVSIKPTFSEVRQMMAAVYGSTPTRRETVLTEIKTADDFGKAIQSGVWLTYFSSPSCGPCRRMTPIVTALSETHNVVKVDIGECPDLATTHDIASIPTLIFFKDGQEMKRLVGLQSEDELRLLFDKMS